MKILTVAELIEQLQTLPQDFVVLAEGCDCVGEAAGARLYKDRKEVIIFRQEDEYEWDQVEDTEEIAK